MGVGSPFRYGCSRDWNRAVSLDSKHHASLSHLAGPAPESRTPNDRPAPRSPAVVFVCFDRGFEAGVLRVESLLSRLSQPNHPIFLTQGLIEYLMTGPEVAL